MIKDYAQRIYSATIVFIWIVFVSATFGIVLASAVNGGISW